MLNGQNERGEGRGQGSLGIRSGSANINLVLFMVNSSTVAPILSELDVNIFSPSDLFSIFPSLLRKVYKLLFRDQELRRPVAHTLIIAYFEIVKVLNR